MQFACNELVYQLQGISKILDYKCVEWLAIVYKFDIVIEFNLVQNEV